jgi:transcription initiation factor IIE alpha subunit
MRTLMVVLTVFFVMGNAVAETVVVANKNEVQKTVYVCPMHPKEISDKKGKCSKCGMDLVVSKPTAKETHAATVKNKYVCTMDGSRADKPGKCPKCGMALTESKPKKSK